MECSEYMLGDVYACPDLPLCRCPNCKGFLPRHLPMDEPFTCKKCKTELMVFPHVYEDGTSTEEYGKICPLKQEET